MNTKTDGKIIELLVASNDQMGTLAANTVNDVLSSWEPHMVIMTGMAAGNPNEVNLGDVIVAESAVDMNGVVANCSPKAKRHTHSTRTSEWIMRSAAMCSTSAIIMSMSGLKFARISDLVIRSALSLKQWLLS